MVVDHRGANVLMPKEFLQRADVVAVGQHVCRRQMATCMDSPGPFNAPGSGVQEGVTFGEPAFGESDLLQFTVGLRAGSWTSFGG